MIIRSAMRIAAIALCLLQSAKNHPRSASHELLSRYFCERLWYPIIIDTRRGGDCFGVLAPGLGRGHFMHGRFQ